MNLKKIKKIIILLMIILIILIGILFVVRYYHSKSYIEKLLNESANLINCKTVNDSSTTYVYGQRKKIVFKNGDIIFYDFEKEKMIVILNERKEINISKPKKENSTYFSKYSDINEYKDYEYKGIQKLNEYQCIVVDLFNFDEKGYLLKRLWINKELGIIEKIEYYNVDNNKEKLLSEKEYNMHTNEVTEIDVEEPDLTKYNDFKITNKLDS